MWGSFCNIRRYFIFSSTLIPCVIYVTSFRVTAFFSDVFPIIMVAFTGRTDFTVSLIFSRISGGSGMVKKSSISSFFKGIKNSQDNGYANTKKTASGKFFRST